MDPQYGHYYKKKGDVIMKKISRCALLVVALILATFIGAHSAIAADKVVIKAGHHNPADSVFDYGFQIFKGKLNELSNGTMEVRIFPAGQLGDQSELIQQLQSGTVQMALTSCADLANFAKNVGLLDVPYLFATKEQAWNAMDGEAGQYYSKYIFDEVGVRVCGYWNGGTRSVFSNKGPIKTVEDMKGLRIRTQPADVHVNSFTALGATVTPISFTELYSALQQGVVDAAENDPSSFYTMKFYEVCKYYSLTEHIQQVATSIVMVSPKFYDSLSEQQRGWFDEACAYAQTQQRKYVEESSAKYMELLEKEGVKINTVDKESFTNAIEPFYESFVIPTYGAELVSMIQNTPIK